MAQNIKLKRTISFPGLLFFGLGTMLGAGFYALTGEIAGIAGASLPLAFLGAGCLALLNGFTFAELSSRLPFSAGEAAYVFEGFGRQWLSRAVGVLVMTTGVVSASTLSVATIGFIQDVAKVPEAAGIAILVLVMGVIAAWGIRTSVVTVVVITVIEIVGILFVLAVSGHNLADVPSRINEIMPGFSTMGWLAVASGSFVAFYAFIGFEDMVNMAEEVREVRRNLPRAILASVVITTLLYFTVSLAAVMTVSPAELAAANTPMAAVVGGNGGLAGKFMILVSILTGINGALVQIIMASRVAYGMASRGQLPGWIGDIHPFTRTPLKATVLITLIILALAFFFPLVTLAQITSFVMLVVFAILNAALFRMKRRGDPLPEDARSYPIIFPILGFVTCTTVLAFRIILSFG